MSKRTSRVRRGMKSKAIQRNCDRPRLVVYRSACNIYSQIVVKGENGDIVLVSCSTLDTELKPSLNGTKVEKAHQVGKLLGERAKAKEIINVAFDRSGYKYHGRVKALADGARAAGLNF
ncbi:50S ribosomal protein L18 [Legionella sp. D16C41]|uniref:50S ribosomal protein L18 n=1 Tax=Legionella sp. D16C41 TaxID=3402688 RepID=UPI003AF99D4F